MAADMTDQILSYLASITVVSGLLTTSTYPGVYTTDISRNGTVLTGSSLQVAFRICNALSFVMSLVAIVVSFFFGYRLIKMRQYRVLENLEAHKWVGVCLNVALYSMIGSVVGALLALSFVSKSLDYGATFEVTVAATIVAGVALVAAFLWKAPIFSPRVAEQSSIIDVVQGEAVGAFHTLVKAIALRNFLIARNERDTLDSASSILLTEVMMLAAVEAVEDAAEALFKSMVELFKAQADTLEIPSLIVFKKMRDLVGVMKDFTEEATMLSSATTVLEHELHWENAGDSMPSAAITRTHNLKKCQKEMLKAIKDKIKGSESEDLVRGLQSALTTREGRHARAESIVNIAKFAGLLKGTSPV